MRLNHHISNRYFTNTLITNITTPGGFLRSIRKRVWRTPAFIVDGKKKIIGIPDEAELLKSIKAALAPRIMV